MEDSYCRICTNDGIFVDLFAKQECRTYIQEIIKCLPIKVSEDDEFSCKVCHKCTFKLKLCSELIDQFQGLHNQIKEPSDTLCFVCSKSDGIIFEVKEGASKYANLLVNLQSLTNEVHVNDSVPKKICHHCAFKLDTLHDVRQLSLESEEKLTKMRNYYMRTRLSNMPKKVSSPPIDDSTDKFQTTKSHKVRPTTGTNDERFSNETELASPAIITPLIASIKVEEMSNTNIHSLESTIPISTRLSRRNKGSITLSPTSVTSKETNQTQTSTRETSQQVTSETRISTSLPFVKLIPLNLFKQSGTICLNNDMDFKINEKSHYKSKLKIQQEIESDELDINVLKIIKKEPDIDIEEVDNETVSDNLFTSRPLTRQHGFTRLSKSSNPVCLKRKNLANYSSNTKNVFSSTQPKQQRVASTHANLVCVGNTKKQSVSLTGHTVGTNVAVKKQSVSYTGRGVKKNVAAKKVIIEKEAELTRKNSSNSDFNTCVDCGKDYSGLCTGINVCDTCMTDRQSKTNVSQISCKTCRVHLVDITKVVGIFDMFSTYLVPHDGSTKIIRQGTPLLGKRKRNSNASGGSKIKHLAKRTGHEDQDKNGSAGEKNECTDKIVPRLKLRVYEGVHEIVDVEKPRIGPKKFKDQLNNGECKIEKPNLRTNNCDSMIGPQICLRNNKDTSDNTKNFECYVSVRKVNDKVIKHKSEVNGRRMRNAKLKLNESKPIPKIEHEIVSQKKKIHHSSLEKDDGVVRKKMVSNQVRAGMKVKANYPLKRKRNQNGQVFSRTLKRYKLRTVHNEGNVNNGYSLQDIVDKQDSAKIIHMASYTCNICTTVFPSNVQRKCHELTHNDKILKLVIEKYIPINRKPTNISTSRFESSVDSSNHENRTHNLLNNGLVFIPDEIINGEILIDKCDSFEANSTATSVFKCEPDASGTCMQDTSIDVFKESVILPTRSTENDSGNSDGMRVMDDKIKTIDTLNVAADIHMEDLAKITGNNVVTAVIENSTDIAATTIKERSCITHEKSEESLVQDASEEQNNEVSTEKSEESLVQDASKKQNNEVCTEKSEERLIQDAPEEQNNEVSTLKSKECLVQDAYEEQNNKVCTEKSEDSLVQDASKEQNNDVSTEKSEASLVQDASEEQNNEVCAEKSETSLVQDASEEQNNEVCTETSETSLVQDACEEQNNEVSTVKSKESLVQDASEEQNIEVCTETSETTLVQDASEQNNEVSTVKSKESFVQDASEEHNNEVSTVKSKESLVQDVFEEQKNGVCTETSETTLVQDASEEQNNEMSTVKSKESLVQDASKEQNNKVSTEKSEASLIQDASEEQNNEVCTEKSERSLVQDASEQNNEMSTVKSKESLVQDASEEQNNEECTEKSETSLVQDASEQNNEVSTVKSKESLVQDASEEQNNEECTEKSETSLVQDASEQNNEVSTVKSEERNLLEVLTVTDKDDLFNVNNSDKYLLEINNQNNVKKTLTSALEDINKGESNSSAETILLINDQKFITERDSAQNSDGLGAAGVEIESLMENIFRICVDDGIKTKLSEENSREVFDKTIIDENSSDVSGNNCNKVTKSSSPVMKKNCTGITLNESTTYAEDESATLNNIVDEDQTEVTHAGSPSIDNENCSNLNVCCRVSKDDSEIDNNVTDINVFNEDISKGEEISLDDVDAKPNNINDLDEPVGGHVDNGSRKGYDTVLGKLEKYLEPISDDETNFE